jgi:Xaa-Pro aminopeptidase
VSGLGYSALLVPIEGGTTLISPLGFQADRVVGVEKTKVGTNFTRDLLDTIRESGLNGSRVAIAGGDIIPAIYFDELKRESPQITFEYDDRLLTEQRLVKSDHELRLIRHASKIADKAMAAAIEAIKPGITESAIGSIARETAMQAGADYVVRDRVQSGREMGKLRWPFASSKKIRRGELVSIDFVGWAWTYGFDILRIGCAGRPNKRQRKLIDVAGRATEAMSDALTDGNTIESSLSELKKFEREDFKVSPFGHGIGLEIVENPYLLPGVSGKLRKNMVLCVEPDVRWKGNFASIENEVVVARGKPEVMTKLPIFWD